MAVWMEIMEELSRFSTAISFRPSIPVVAIGGLKQDNLSVLEGCPISGIAVVSAIMSSATPGIAARELAAMAKKLVELGRAKNA